jgi:hypothetical protein
MKKYRLIKLFPLLPDDWEFGMELGLKREYFPYTPCDSKYTDLSLAQLQVENNPEFFEEIVEKAYQILWLECVTESKERVIISVENGLDNICKYSGIKQNSITLDTIVRNWIVVFGSWRIYEIKRLSDGEIFTVNMLMNDFFDCNEEGEERRLINIIPCKQQDRITFEIGSNKTIGMNTKHTYPLEYWKKVKKPLFVTDDNVEVFEGDNIYIVYLPLTSNTKVLDRPFTIPKDWVRFSHTKTFVHKENFEEYIFKNKPCLSLKEVKMIFLNGGEGLEELVRSRV